MPVPRYNSVHPYWPSDKVALRYVCETCQVTRVSKADRPRCWFCGTSRIHPGRGTGPADPRVRDMDVHVPGLNFAPDVGQAADSVLAQR